MPATVNPVRLTLWEIARADRRFTERRIRGSRPVQKPKEKK